MTVKTAVVSMSEIAAQPGMPLSADYWVNREPGETWPRFQRRREAERLQASADELSARARRMRTEARRLLKLNEQETAT